MFSYDKNDARYLNVNVSNADDNRVYLWNKPNDKTCQWIIKQSSQGVYTIQNVRNVNANKWSYLNVNVSDKKDKNVFLWNRPTDKTCQWIIEPFLHAFPS
jgi:hypothetical protein